MKRAINTFKRWLVQTFGLPIYQITNRVVVERFYSEFDEQFYKKDTKIQSFNYVNDSETDKKTIILQSEAEIVGARVIVSDGNVIEQFREGLRLNDSSSQFIHLLLYKTAIQNQHDTIECIFSHYAPVNHIKFDLLPKTTVSILIIIKNEDGKESN